MITNFDWMGAITESPIFLVLVGCSIITLAITLERAWYYWKRSGNADQTFSFAMQKLGSGAVDEATWALKSTPHPMGIAALQVIQNLGRPGTSIEEKLQITLSQQKMLLERNLGLLGTLAAVAPLIGLLGTVWGIMRAFHDMSLAGSAAPSVVAAGVAEALTTTAAGLVVAVPAVLLYNHFSRRMNVMLTEAENNALSIRNTMNELGLSGTDVDHTQRAA
jgi:biopolymer transport protein ExbB